MVFLVSIDIPEWIIYGFCVDRERGGTEEEEETYRINENYSNALIS